jgi:fused signal recognition particle receptor
VDPVLLVVLVVAVVLLLGVGLVTSRQRRRLPRLDLPDASTTARTASSGQVLLPDDLEPGLPVETGALDTPDPTSGRLQRLRGRLVRSQSTLGIGLLSLLSRPSVDDATWDEVEETLLVSDLGVAPTAQLVERLRARVRSDAVADPAAVRAMLREELLALVDPSLDRTVHTARAEQGQPAVVLVVGVNGTGKTTTTGKLARVLVADGRTVLLGAADTFRAAAAEQLQT